MRKKIIDLLTDDSVFIDKPATINVELVDGKTNVSLKGEFADVLGASLDFISGTIESNPIFARHFIRQTIKDKGRRFKKEIKKHNYNIENATMNFHIEADRNIHFFCEGKPIEYILCILAMIEYLVDYYNISYREYYEFFINADDMFVRNRNKERMKGFMKGEFKS